MFLRRRNVNIAITGIRQIHSCATSCTMDRQARMLVKLMTGSRRRRKNWFEGENQVKMPLFPTSKRFSEGPLKKNRRDVLNKLLMSSITDLLSTGEVTTDLIGRGLSITRVATSPDFNVVNIYWSAKETVHDMEFEKVLQKAAFDLRHELSQLHVLGVVPRICFVADKRYAILETMDLCFEKLKLEGDLVEEHFGEYLSERTLETSLDPNTLEHIKKMEEEEIEAYLPEMTHNVLDLDHSNIMKKINAAVVKSEARHRNKDDDNDSVTEVEKISSVSDCQNEGLYDVAQYIAKKRIQEKKMLRAQEKKLLNLYVDSKSSDHEEEYVDDGDEDFIEDFEESLKK